MNRISLYISLALGLLLGILSPAAWAVDFNASNSTELQMALTSAATNATDDTITLSAGTFSTADNGNMVFGYSPGFNAGSLTLIGAGAGQTILDGNNAQQVMNLADFMSSGQISITGITFQNALTNAAAGAGLGINVTNLDVIIDQCEFKNNQNDVAASGADLQTSNGTLLFNGNLVTGNQATTAGNGGVRFSVGDGLVTITNNIFYKNSTVGTGGAFSLLSFGTNSNNIINNTIYMNSAGNNGGGVELAPGNSGIVNFWNNIVYGNTAGGSGADIYGNGAASGTLNLFFNDFTDFQDDGGSNVNQGNNPDTDPLIQDAVGGNFQLQATSPVIDQGSNNAPGLPNMDFADHPRPIGPKPDIGALEAFPTVEADSTQLDFGEIPLAQSSQQTLTLSNDGNYPLTIIGFGFVGSGDFVVDSNGGTAPCGSDTPTIAPSESCTMLITYTSASGGIVTATLTFTSDDPNNSTLSINLTGGVPDGGGGCRLQAQANNPGLWVLFGLILALSSWLFYRQRN